MKSCIDNLKTVLSKVNVRSLLVNGNAEKQLKFLMASSHDEGEAWYLMDKKFSNHEVDLILFDGQEAKSVAELKCTFAWDSKRVERDVADAIVKAEISKLLAETGEGESWSNIKNNASHYIVHFLLLSDPRADNKPKWINKKYNVPCAYVSNNAVDAVHQKYSERYPDKVKRISIIEDVLDVVFVELQEKEVSVCC